MKHRNNRFGQSRIWGRCKVPMNLQFFGDGDGGDGGSDDGSQGAGGAGTDPKKKEEGEGGNNEFDQFLSNPANQSEFDKRVAKALETHGSKLKAEFAKTAEKEKEEAAKLAKMNADQKAEYEREKQKAELAEREANINKRELTATAKEILADKELPMGLSDLLNYEDADKCKASIETLEKAFRDAVAKEVDNKLKGGKPPKAGTEQGSSLEEEIKKSMGL